MNRIIAALLLCIATSVNAADPVEVADNAPDQYVVKRGDTLWDISGRFLKKPWRWPEIWHMNSKQIHDPHWIYPGQVVYLDRNGPSLSLGKPHSGSGEIPTEHLSPQVYSEPVDGPISSVSLDAIRPFLTQPLVVDDAKMADAGVIIALEEQRVVVGAGETVFAKNVASGEELWNVFRKAKPIKDPVTQELLGYEAEFLGSAKLVQDGTPATMQIATAAHEIGKGDRLMPAPKPELIAYVPHPSPAGVSGHIVGINGGLTDAGRNSVVTIGVGSTSGIEPGHVMTLYRNRGKAEYREDSGDKPEVFELPEQRYGTVFIFRVFDRVSYGLVMDSDGPARVADTAKSPD